jgi:hypothetical protein
VSCWTEHVWDPVRLRDSPITRCRIAGGETVDYASDSSVPSVLFPNLGTDLTGECWYYTSASTAYVILAQYADGSAEIGLDIDPTTPDGIVAIGPVLPRCTSEPGSAADPGADAWAYVMSYIHDPPIPDLSPEPGQGITGLATYLGVVVPPDHDASLTSGASDLDVEIDVDLVVVTWGDGAVDSFPPSEEILAGWPDGSATHVYEMSRPEGAPITVEYDWSARWRADGGPWTVLPVPNTSTAVDYPVAQVVSRLDG